MDLDCDDKLFLDFEFRALILLRVSDFLASAASLDPRHLRGRLRDKGA